MKNNDSFNGGTNIGSGNSIGRDQTINIIHSQTEQPVAKYDVEPIWRSPITMGILTWIGFFTSIGSLLPLYKFFQPIIVLLSKPFDENIPDIQDNQIYLFVFLGLFSFSIVIFYLRKITKNQTRHPLKFNYAISGVGEKLSIEKMNPSPCPICGGNLRYYNKPDKWINYYDEKGKFQNRRITERLSALECIRNNEHFWYVDPAGTKV